MSSNRVIDGVPGGQRRSYISTDIFTDNFYTYRTEVQDTTTVGIWGNVSSDPTQCPKGRILRENGRKLYPDVNPGVASFYVGVYDDKTFKNGFINPNDRVFATFNSNMPVYLNTDYAEDDAEDELGDDDCSSVQDLGEPVYTRGRIETTCGDIIANDNDGSNIISLQNDISGGNFAYFGMDGEHNPYAGFESDNGRTSAYIGATPTNAYIGLYAGGQVVANANDGSIYMSGVLHPYNACGTVTLVSSVGTLSRPLFATGNAVVLLTRKNTTNGTKGHLSYSITNSTITVNSSSADEASVINYLIISSNN